MKCRFLAPVVGCLVLTLVLGACSSQSPRDAARTPDGYVQSDAEYKGHDEFRLNGKPIASFPLVTANENVMPPVGMVENLAAPDKLLAQAVSTSGPRVVDFGSLDASVKALPIEQRAISDSRHQAETGGNVNILLGTQYALGAKNYADINRGVVDTARKSFDEYLDPIAYFERDGAKVSAVLVTTSTVTGSSGGLNQFFETSDGLSVAYSIRGQFLTDLNLLRAWTARSFAANCTLDSVASNCLYRASQGVLAFQGHDQIILTGPVNLLEYDRQAADSGSREIRTLYTMSTAPDGTQQVRIGSGSGQYIYAKDPGALDKLNDYRARGQLVVLSGPNLASLPTYTLTSSG